MTLVWRDVVLLCLSLGLIRLFSVLSFGVALPLCLGLGFRFTVGASLVQMLLLSNTLAFWRGGFRTLEYFLEVLILFGHWAGHEGRYQPWPKRSLAMLFYQVWPTPCFSFKCRVAGRLGWEVVRVGAPKGEAPKVWPEPKNMRP